VSAVPASRLPLVLVAAVAENGVIGGDNRLLWRLSSDLKRFRALTMGKPLIMGRLTFQSIGRPLPGRETIVLTRDAAFQASGAHVAASLDDAIARATVCAQTLGADEIMVVGGGDVYRQAMPHATRLEITEVALSPEGDAHFPVIDAQAWQLVSRESQVQGPGDEAAFAYCVYERMSASPP